VQDARKAEYLQQRSTYVLVQIKVSLTCPHFVIRGAIGLDRQIGHDVCPSARLDSTVPMMEDRGMMTCKISRHCRKL
jgi:hypothetical protein